MDSKLTGETQMQRWLKYGSNAVLACLVVIAIAVIATILGQKYAQRADLTQSKMYSLKPQTLNIIREIKSPVKLISLYRTTDETGTRIESAQIVADLLQEYRRKGKNIEVELIDPVTERDKQEALYDEIIKRYGGELANYKTLLNDYVATIGPALEKYAAEEEKAVAAFQGRKAGASQDSRVAAAIVQLLGDLPEQLKQARQSVSSELKQPRPEYKQQVDVLKVLLSDLADNLRGISDRLPKLQLSKDIGEDLRAYFKASQARHDAAKKQVADITERIGKLGESKVDDLRRQLDVVDPVLILAEKDWRVIPSNQVWQVDEKSIRGMAEDVKIKPAFAGEQMITTAILSLTSDTKPRVVFIRPGGAPLTSPPIPFMSEGGPYYRVAERLRGYNYEVLEKDLSGQWAMQQQMRGMMPSGAADATDEQMKGAVWVVIATQQPQQRMQQAPPPDIAGKLAEHLKNGGSAMALVDTQADNLASALGDWGIEAKTNIIAVHEALPQTGAATGDIVEQAMHFPPIFVLKQYGDASFTKPLNSLDAVMVPMVVVQTNKKDGVTTTPILPVPLMTGKIWGETNVEGVFREGVAKYDADQGDIEGPLFAGAAAEKKDAGRVVVIGSTSLIANDLVRLPDPELLRRGVRVARFPGNAELFLNSIFWLSKQETMIAISPAAMEISRIPDISKGMLQVWHWGVLVFGMPALVVVAGLVVYVRRRD